jgi:CelD/BcsL family acetyltransferase involved in cellulose biosynthesis
MNLSITDESLESLKSYRAASRSKLNWSSVFVLPEWMDVWLRVFGEGVAVLIKAVRQGDEVIAVAPLVIENETALFIGNTDVCDYLDLIMAPGHEKEPLDLLLQDLEKNNIKRLDLKHVRSDSVVLNVLAPLAESRGYRVTTVKDNVSFEMDLPSSFDDYLDKLSAKQRHEVRRKLRRLNEEGTVQFRFIDEAAVVPAAMDAFFKMFVESRRDKADFMTDRMALFFRLLAEAMGRLGLLKLGVLELDGRSLAEIMCFDYQDCIYLYNSGYDPGYVSLSARLLSKVLAIKDSIEKGKKKFDFLKGEETYKHHLGGKEVPLFRCQIAI